MSSTVTGLFIGYYRFLKGMPQAPKWTIGGFSVFTLLVFIIDSLIISDDYFTAVAHLTITFQAIKSFDLKEPWDHLQVYFMSLLQLIVASELTYSIAFGFMFILFLVTLVAAIVVAHFMKEGIALKVDIKKPVTYISLMTLIITIILFISAPRVSHGIWGKTHKKSVRTVGFSERVDFGSFGVLKLDPTVIMRFEINGDVKPPYYWRGLTLNYFDGISWKNTLEKKEKIKKGDKFILRPFQEDKAISQKIFLEPMDTDVIFGLSEIVAVESVGIILFMDRAKSLFLPFKKGKQFNYIAYSTSGLKPFRDDATDYLQLPAGVERISRLAKNLIDKNDRDLQKAMKIEKYLRENYTYSLSVSQPPPGMSPVEDFLFSSKRGYCEHYATAMVLMLRSIGIPARIVTGFLGGELNDYGGYMIVRQSDAHSWVEAVIDKKWELFDPTPSVSGGHFSGYALFLDMLKMKWNRYVVAFSVNDQREIIKTFSLPFRLRFATSLRLKELPAVIYVILFVTAIVITIFLLRKVRFRRYEFVTQQYIRLRNHIRKKGIEITPSLTPSEIKRKVHNLHTDSIEEFISLYEEHRFGGRDMIGKERARYQMLLKEIKRQIKS